MRVGAAAGVMGPGPGPTARAGAAGGNVRDRCARTGRGLTTPVSQEVEPPVVADAASRLRLPGDRSVVLTSLPWVGLSVLASLVVALQTERRDAALVLAAVVGPACTVILVVLARRRQVRDARAVQRLLDVATVRADQIAVLSHEIRTPLAVIKGAADLLAEGVPGPLTSRQERFVTTIAQNSVGVISLAEEMLAEARIEAGLFEITPATCDVVRLVRSTVQDLRRVHGPRFVLDLPTLPVPVDIDAPQMARVVTNLVNNAVRHSREDGVVTVVLRRREGEILISVADDGEGISQQEIRQLFSRFHTGHTHSRGTGLGLYVSRQIVALHRGRILVDTVPGRGTTFLVTLPLDAG